VALSDGRREGPPKLGIQRSGASHPQSEAHVGCRPVATVKVHSTKTVVALLGSFNPRIFEPRWFSEEGLVARPEAAEAEVQMIDHDFCHLNFGWVDLIATEDRLQAESTGETVNDGQVRDLLVGIFRLLPHTPVRVGSIHHRWQLKVDSEDAWHDVGHSLAPKEIWDEVLEKPGLFDFAMQGDRPDDFQGAIKVRIQPSRAVSSGVFINVNDEFVLPEDEASAEPIADVLETLWPVAENRAMEIKNVLIGRLVP
jgi:hypothetical protein